MPNKQAIRVELAQLQKEHGLLRAEDVVNFARNEDTALHGEFEWDDSEAAHQYRLAQARKIIRVNVQILPTGHDNVVVPVYVSLAQDRDQPGGGYRRLVDVMSDEELRAQLLQQALTDFERVGRRYRTLKELAPIFEALEQISQVIRAELTRV